ncbi:MAG: family 1 extracellular solute-binding protein, partial [Paenibacillus sp.]|nr:family 1 extracellular solute-binding protein [Paenibacillus sp.]
MRNAKQLFSVLLIVALASGTLLAGCTGNSSKDNKAEIKGEAKKEEITVSIYDRGQVPADEGKLEDNRWTRWINENAPAHVKFVPIPRLEAKQKLNVLFASGSAPDLIFEFSRTVKDPLYEQKQLMPLDDLIQKHSTNYKKLIEQFPSLAKAGKKSDGKIYEFGKLNEVRPQNGILIRNDWLKKLNLEVPKTTEDLYKVAKAFAERDPDGNGKKDTYGLALSSNANDIVNMMFQHVNWVIKNGQMTHDWDNAKEAVAFKERLYDEGIIDKDFLNDKNGAKAKQHFITGKLGIYPLQFGWNQFGVQILQPLKKNVPEAEIIPIALPASPAGAFNPLWSNPVQTTAVI